MLKCGAFTLPQVENGSPKAVSLFWKGDVGFGKHHCQVKHVKLCLEDHSSTCKWLITMVSFRPLRIGLWDPFQMASFWLAQMGVILTTYVRPGMILPVGVVPEAD